MRNLAACIQFLDDPNLGITGVLWVGTPKSAINMGQELMYTISDGQAA
jgi:hypothetical protein